MTTYTMTSTKGSREIEGTIEDAVAAAIAMEAELQPAYGVDVEDESGETVVEVRDGIIRLRIDQPLNGYVRIHADEEYSSETWWDAFRERFPELAEHIGFGCDVAVTPATLAILKSLPEWDAGPAHARTCCVVRD